MLDLVYLIFSALILMFTAWTLYSVPVLVVGVKRLLISRKSIDQRRQCPPEVGEYAPVVSIIVPAKNEEKVIGRLLHALLNLNYPESKFEIIVVNDGSSDRTSEICKSFESR